MARPVKPPYSLPARRVLVSLHRLTSLKTLTLFTSFFLSVAVLSMARIDTATGRQSMSWLRRAHRNVNLQPLNHLDTTQEIAEFYDTGLPAVVLSLHQICPHCAVGITPHARELQFLGLESFICSSFESAQGSEEYPNRDCAAADRAWAKHPTSTSAPCCSNATLVMASIAMMTERNEYGIQAMPLATLLTGGSDPSYDSVPRFITKYIDQHQFLVQVVISQDQHMAAAQYHAHWINKENAPGLVRTEATYWSFNYSNPHLATQLQAIMLAFLALTFMQDRWLRNAAKARQARSAARALHAARADLAHGETRHAAGAISSAAPPEPARANGGGGGGGGGEGPPGGSASNDGARVPKQQSLRSFLLQHMDVNKDGKVDASDLLVLLGKEHPDESLALARAVAGGVSAGDVSSKEQTASRFYVLAIEWPSTLLPLVLEVARPYLALPTWANLVAASEMLLSIRLFHDAAHVVPPCGFFNRILTRKPTHPRLLEP